MRCGDELSYCIGRTLKGSMPLKQLRIWHSRTGSILRIGHETHPAWYSIKEIWKRFPSPQSRPETTICYSVQTFPNHRDRTMLIPNKAIGRHWRLIRCPPSMADLRGSAMKRILRNRLGRLIPKIRNHNASNILIKLDRDKPFMIQSNTKKYLKSIKIYKILSRFSIPSLSFSFIFYTLSYFILS